MESHNIEGNGAILEIQHKLQWLGKQAKAVPVIETFKDIRWLDSSLAALTNKVEFDGPDVALQT